MKQIDIAVPPMISGLRRPHRSTQIWAGMVHSNITMPVTPDDKNEAFVDVRPACWKRLGA